MKKKRNSTTNISSILAKISDLHDSITHYDNTDGGVTLDEATAAKLVKNSGQLITDLQHLRERISPVHFGSIGITLGRSDGIAKFFAFSFISQEKRAFTGLLERPFYGSGVYALYYHGTNEEAYRPLSASETPIYVGKADPKNPQAETVEAQGQVLFRRLKEHAKAIRQTQLDLSDFCFRAAPIQTGMQLAVEDFMVRLFHPIWNLEVKGIGKHGDSATTRANKRSRWDTMHPGRKWADATIEDQMSRPEIEARLAAHFKTHPVIPDKDTLHKLLALG